MVTLQGFGDVEENVLNPNLHLVPKSVKQEAEQPWCSGAPVRKNRAERVQIENTLSAHIIALLSSWVSQQQSVFIRGFYPAYLTLTTRSTFPPLCQNPAVSALLRTESAAKFRKENKRCKKKKTAGGSFQIQNVRWKKALPPKPEGESWLGQMYIIKRINTGHYPSTSQPQPHSPDAQKYFMLSYPLSQPAPPHQVRYLALNNAHSAVITLKVAELH